MSHYATQTRSSEERTAAMLAHGSALIAMIVSVGWLSFVGPLLVWLMMRDRPYARKAAAQAFNFNVAITLLMILGWVLVFTAILAPVGGVLMAVAALLQIWCHAHGTLRASRGASYDYPFQVRLLS